ncbi:MAG: potassium transporter TrkG [Alphaproteobacteria bacterium]
MATGSVFHGLGWVILIVAAAMMLPLVAAGGPAEPGVLRAFLVSAVITGFAGGGLVVSLRGKRRVTGPREAMLLAALSFAAVPLFAALPVYTSLAQAGVVDAWFETVSGLTTTGAPLFDAAELAPQILLWRSLLEWLGGLGILAVAAAILSGLGQAPLPVQPVPEPAVQGEPSLPHLEEAFRLVAPYYAGLTALLLLAVLLTGMPFAQGLRLTLSTISTGGFGAPGGLDHSPAVLIVVMAGLAAGSFNILLHWYGVRGRFGVYGNDPETRVLLALIVSGGAVLAIAATWFGGWTPFQAVFNTVSLISTSGVLVAPEGAVPIPLPLLLVPVMIGGSALSTAGGMKAVRVGVMFRQAENELERLAFPHRVIRNRFGERRVTVGLAMAIWASFIGYGGAISLLALAVAASGFEFGVALTAAVAAVSNAGPVLFAADGAPASYAGFSEPIRILLGAAMIAGRLEVLLLLCLLNPAYWRI